MSRSVTHLVVTVEVVQHRTQMRRFTDIPFLLFRDDDRWRPGVRFFEQWRLDERRHPYFDHGYAAYFLARRQGQPIGRIAAHLPRSGAKDGRFGFLDAPDDADVVSALIDAAREWLDEEGATSMQGPLSWTADEGFGVVVDGADAPGLTGRPWQPRYYADHLEAAGLTGTDVQRTYRLEVGAVAASSPPPSSTDVDIPPQAGRYADRALVFETIAAVPDVAGIIKSTSVRSAWRAARAIREGDLDTAVCVRCDGDAEVLVPQLAAAARDAGYRWLVAPWAPHGQAPETVHQIFACDW